MRPRCTYMNVCAYNVLMHVRVHVLISLSVHKLYGSLDFVILTLRSSMAVAEFKKTSVSTPTYHVQSR